MIGRVSPHVPLLAVLATSLGLAPGANPGLSATQPAQLNVNFTYDPNGNVATRTDGNGVVTRYAYDAMNRLVAVRYPAGPDVTFEYDAAGRLTRMRDGIGVATYEYDVLGRLTRSVNSAGHELRYAYDPRGLPERLTYPDGSQVNYLWDPDGRLQGVQDADGITIYDRDAGGRVVGRELPNGVRTRYGYDAAGRLASVEHVDRDANPLLRFDYRYDAVGNRIGMARTDAGGRVEATEYAYDGAYRLARVAHPDGEVVAYEYDLAGRRVAMTSSRGGRWAFTHEGGLLTRIDGPDGSDRLRYDGNNNLIAYEPASGPAVRLAYDHENRLVRRERGPEIVDYAYDGAGAMLRRDGGGVSRQFLHGGGGIPVGFVGEVGPDGRLVRFPVGVERLGQAGVPAEARFYLTDGFGNVAAHVDRRGALNATARYDPFGRPRGEQVPATGAWVAGLPFDPVLPLRTPVGVPNPMLGPVGLLGTPVHRALVDWTVTGLVGPGVRARNRDVLVDIGLGAVGEVFPSLGFPLGFLQGLMTGIEVDQAIREGSSPLAIGNRIMTPFVSLTASELAKGWAGQGLAHGLRLGAPHALKAGLVGVFAIEVGVAVSLWQRVFSLLYDIESANRQRRNLERQTARMAAAYHAPDPSRAARRVGVTGGEPREDDDVVGDPFRRDNMFFGGNDGGPPFCPGCDGGDDEGGGGGGGGGPGPPGGGGGAAVGGISLDRVAEVVADLRDITGARFDAASGQVVLTGRRDLALPPMDLSDLVVAIRTIYAGQEPSMSIEPCHPPAEDRCMKVLYNGRFQDPDHVEGWLRFGPSGIVRADPPTTFGTSFGHVLFEADRYLKTATIGRDNLPPHAPFHTAVAGFQSLLARFAATAGGRGSRPADCRLPAAGSPGGGSPCYRMWFVPDTIVLRVTDDGRTMEFDTVRILTLARYVRFDSVGRMVDVPGRDSVIAAFTADFDEHYLDLAREQPDLARLVQLAKAVALVRWLHDNHIPVDLDWVDRAEVTADSTPLVTPAIWSDSSTVRLYGGVAFPDSNIYRPAPPGAEAFASRAIAGRDSRATVSWDVERDGETLDAVALTLAPSAVAGGYVDERRDVTVPVAPDLTVHFTRRYTSVDPEPGPLGRGWRHVWPALRIRRVPDAANRRSFFTEAVLTIGAVRTVFSLSSEGIFRPVDPASPFRALGMTGDDPYAPFFTPGLAPAPAMPDRPIPVRDREGGAVSYTGFAAVHRDGRVLAFDDRGRLRAVRAPGGHEIHAAYDSMGLLTSVLDGNDAGIRLQYDADGGLATVRASSGDRVTYTRDGRGDLVVAAHDGDRTWRYAYDDAGRLVEAGAGPALLFEGRYDALGRLTSERAGGGGGITAAYDDRANTVRYTDHEGRSVTHRYDEDGRLVAETDPWDHTRTYEYDDADRLTAVTDASGNTTRYAYDASGRFEAVTWPDGQRHRVLGYTELGQPHMTLGPGDGLVIVEYDGRGRPITVTAGHRFREQRSDGTVVSTPQAPAETAYQYDAAGRITALRDPGGFVTRFAYDPLGNLTNATLPSGAAVTGTYDEESRLSSVTDPSGRTTSMTYGAEGSLQTVRTPEGDTRFAVTGGLVEAVTDPMGATRAYEHDTSGRLVAAVGPGGGRTSFEYDDGGNLRAVVGPTGDRVEYAYDAFGRVVGIRAGR